MPQRSMAGASRLRLPYHRRHSHSQEDQMIAFTGCELLAAAQARFRTRTPARAKGHMRAAGAPTRRRREVKVGGRRVKVIDVHAHCVIPEAYACSGSRSTTIADPESAKSVSAASVRWTRRAST